MAFKDQVQDLTSLTVSDNDELSQFLKDGVIDVTRRSLIARPQDAEAFMAVTAELTSNGYDLNTSRIINVVREDGNDNQWRNCRKIAPASQYDVTDTESLNYASKINPAYMIGEDNQISVFPVATSSPAQNAYKIYYVNNDPQNESGVALAYSHSDIKYFPTDKVYLVVIYASMKLLQATMGSSIIGITAVPPDVPTLSTQSVTITGTAPTYSQPQVGGADEELTTQMTAGVAGTDSDKIDWTDWWDVVADYIEDQEDIELAGTQLQKISTYVSAYTQAMQNQLNVFNDANIEYQAILQKNMRDAELEDAADSKKLQKYSAEVSEYTAAVNAEVKEQTTKMQHYQLLYSQLKIEYDTAFIIPQGKK